MSALLGRCMRIPSCTHAADVKEARKRILVIEYIQGGQMDDLAYLSDYNIDRNKVGLKLARIFC